MGGRGPAAALGHPGPRRLLRPGRRDRRHAVRAGRPRAGAAPAGRGYARYGQGRRLYDDTRQVDPGGAAGARRRRSWPRPRVAGDAGEPVLVGDRHIGAEHGSGGGHRATRPAARRRHDRRAAGDAVRRRRERVSRVWWCWSGPAVWSWQRGSLGLAVVFGLVAGLPAVTLAKALPWPVLVLVAVLVAVVGWNRWVAHLGDGDPVGRPLPAQGRGRLHPRRRPGRLRGRR